MCGLAEHHAVTRQQLLRYRVTPFRSGAVRRKRRTIQRPPPLCCRRSCAPRPEDCQLIHPPCRFARTARRPFAISSQGSHAIISQQALPHQAPKRLQRLSRIPSAHAIMQILKERSPVPLQVFKNLRLLTPLRRRNRNDVPLIVPQNSLRLLRWNDRPKSGQLLRKIEPDPSIALSNRIHPHPHHLTCRDQSIQVRRLVPDETSLQDLCL